MIKPSSRSRSKAFAIVPRARPDSSRICLTLGIGVLGGYVPSSMAAFRTAYSCTQAGSGLLRVSRSPKVTPATYLRLLLPMSPNGTYITPGAVGTLDRVAQSV